MVAGDGVPVGAWGWASSSVVLPSRSVNRKVTVPEGSSRGATGPGGAGSSLRSPKSPTPPLPLFRATG